MTWTDLLPDPPRYPCANAPECPSMTARRAPDGLCGTCNHERPATVQAPTDTIPAPTRKIHDVMEAL